MIGWQKGIFMFVQINCKWWQRIMNYHATESQALSFQIQLIKLISNTGLGYWWQVSIISMNDQSQTGLKFRHSWQKFLLSHTGKRKKLTQTEIREIRHTPITRKSIQKEQRTKTNSFYDPMDDVADHCSTRFVENVIIGHQIGHILWK